MILYLKFSRICSDVSWRAAKNNKYIYKQIKKKKKNLKLSYFYKVFNKTVFFGGEDNKSFMQNFQCWVFVIIWIKLSHFLNTRHISAVACPNFSCMAQSSSQTILPQSVYLIFNNILLLGITKYTVIQGRISREKSSLSDWQISLWTEWQEDEPEPEIPKESVVTLPHIKTGYQC